MSRLDRSAYRQFRAPRGDGHTLLDPGWADLRGLVEANRAEIAGRRYDFAGLPLGELRAAARASLLHAATGEAGPAAEPPDADRPLVLSGHQPELFHPGVWFKNFVLDRVSAAVGGVGVNLNINSDLCRAPSVKVPTGGVASPWVQAVAFDKAAAPLPFEERRAQSEELFQSFPSRVEQTLGGLVEGPLVRDFWPRVVALASSGGTLGGAISGARHRLELSWGLANAEADISQACDSAPFRWFLVDLLGRLDEFHAAHNRALAEYRTAHKIRTPAQPMPDLHQRDGWLEAPCWVWTSANPERRPLHARPTAGGLLLSDLAGGEWRLPPTSDPDAASAALVELRREGGVKIRSRALLTTLYSRLLAADLFIHGIGGAKYDQVTDRAAELFYGFAPPPHATATATLRLPIEHAAAAPAEPAAIKQRLRELDFHPERFVDPDTPAAASKRRWVATPKTPGNAAERHRAIAQANAALQPLVQPRRAALLAEQDAAAAAAKAAAVTGSREYSFCLFPGGWLREQLQRAAAGR